MTDSKHSPPAPSTAETNRLRDAIDRGLTGDKVPASDPAAAPLGTDDEAAGTTPPLFDARDAVVPEDQRTPPGQKKGGNTFET
ncbi:hypothetical protein [Azospirillum doebereinerae]|uniref:hypothetical protein n=1 Tax=Azospirillum doebereinerae TaxID=92933 RepID=UPI00163C8E58|nr:hypothetical protein [Azospirillum doebereinerae]